MLALSFHECFPFLRNTILKLKVWSYLLLLLTAKICKLAIFLFDLKFYRLYTCLDNHPIRMQIKHARSKNMYIYKPTSKTKLFSANNTKSI